MKPFSHAVEKLLPKTVNAIRQSSQHLCFLWVCFFSSRYTCECEENTLTLSIVSINNLSTYLCNKVYLEDTHFIWNCIPINILCMINWPLNSSVNQKQYYRRIQFHWKLRKSLLFSKQVLKSKFLIIQVPKYLKPSLSDFDLFCI